MRFLLIIAAIALVIGIGLLAMRHGSAPPPAPAPSGNLHAWYIDALEGNDANPGHSERAPWKTLARLLQAPLIPGDTILLRRGGIWRESLNITVSGENDNPISVIAYGEGDAPSVRGSDSFSAPGQWQYEGEGLWYLNDLRSDPGMLIRDEQLATRRATRDDLADPWDFWYDGALRRLYVRLDTNPAAVASLIEVPVRDFVVGPLGGNFLRLVNLDFRHPLKTTVLIWEGDHTVLEGCAFSQSPGTHLQIGQGANYTRVTGCQFDDWNAKGQGGFGVQAVEAGSGPTDVEDCTFTATRMGNGGGHTAIRSEDRAWIRAVRGCRFSGNQGKLSGDGISLTGPSGAANMITIEDNAFESLGGGAISLDGLARYESNLSLSIQRNRIEDVCRGDYLERDAIRVQGLTSAESTLLIACNLIRGTAAGRNPHAGIVLQETRGARVVNNGITGSDDGIALRLCKKDILVANNLLVQNRGVGLRDELSAATCSNNAYFGNGGGNTEGVAPNPSDVLTNPLVDEQLRPQAGSPCINGGVDTGLATDYERRPVPSGSGPDIGPYEFSPSRP